MFDTTLKKTAKQLTNTFLFKEENSFNRNEIGNDFSKNSFAKLISYKCFTCKQRVKDLILSKDANFTNCTKCNSEIDLKKINFKIITGFNNKFFKKIQDIKLKGGEK
jgi:DNA-directed RNA polymerase subunit RPC12/RpoP